MSAKPNQTVCRCVSLSLGFSFPKATFKSITNVFIKSAGSFINIMLKYVAVYTDFFIRFLVIFANLKNLNIECKLKISLKWSN